VRRRYPPGRRGVSTAVSGGKIGNLMNHSSTFLNAPLAHELSDACESEDDNSQARAPLTCKPSKKHSGSAETSGIMNPPSPAVRPTRMSKRHTSGELCVVSTLPNSTMQMYASRFSSEQRLTPLSRDGADQERP